MKKVIFVSLMAFAVNVNADAITDGKAVLDVLSKYGNNPKTLTNQQMLSIVDKYNAANGFSNPWDETLNPVEYAAWPTNLEKATFFLQKLGGEIRSDIGMIAGRQYDETNNANRGAAVKAAEDEL